MPLLRRPPRPADAEAAAGRVRAVLPGPAKVQGWQLPPAPEAGPGEGLPGEAAGSCGPAPRPGAVPDAPVPDAPAPDAPVAVASVLDRLRAARYDPGRRAVLGVLLVGLLACVLAGLLVLRGAPREVVLPEVEHTGRAVPGATLPGGEAAAAAEQVVVAVAGKVREPGLVRLPAGSRVDDAVRAAGGLQPGASAGLLNLARRLVDGEQVLVGVDPPPAAAAPAGAAAPGGLLDLNAAAVGDLDALPGIGPVLAQRIVDHRTRNGPFRSVDQLREVSGIGEAKYADLRDRVTV